MKKVLILCTGNSCRSIIAEALINKYLDGVSAKSAGVKASKMINPLTKEILMKYGIYDESYYSKTIKELNDNDFDLVVTVCDNAQQNCPIFDRSIKTIHIGFEDPDGKDIEYFQKTYNDIKNILLPEISKLL